MHLECPNCGTVYDVSQYTAGHRFACACGRELEVGAPEAAAVDPVSTHASADPGATLPAPAILTSDPGLSTPVKVLLFFGNLCAWPMPIISLIAWFMIRDTRPRTADDVCKYTWIPFVIFLVFFGLYIIFVVGLSMMETAF